MSLGDLEPMWSHGGVIGLILGTGFDCDEGDPLPRRTPWGDVGGDQLAAAPGALVAARHGRGHGLPPHRLDPRALLHAMREEGVDAVVALASAGALREGLAVGDLVILDDFVELGPSLTFHSDRVVHTSMHAPFDAPLARELLVGLDASTVHEGGVYVSVEGPRYPTRAELRFHATLGDVVGMTIAREAALANELGLRYAAICLVTDAADEVELDHERIARAGATTREALRARVAEVARAGLSASGAGR